MKLRRGALGRATAISALVAVVGSVVTLGVCALLRREEVAAGETQMDRRTAAAATAVRAETRRYLDTLRITAAATGAQETMTATEFGTITTPLFSMGLAGATSIALVVPAGDDDVSRVQRTYRGLGVPNLTLNPKGTGEHAFSVFSAALDGRTRNLGLDLMQATAPAAALAEARRSRQIAVSDTYQLITDQVLPASQRQNSFVLVAPVYREIKQTFLGWLVLGVRGQDFMGDTLAETGQGLLDLSLVADNSRDLDVTVASLHTDAGERADLHRQAAVQVADSTWTLRLAACRAHLPGAHSGLPPAVAGGGLSLSALLTVLVWVLTTRGEKARAQVRAATGELRASESETRRQAMLLQAVLDSISDGVGVVDADGAFLMQNPAARTILGQTETDDPIETWQNHFGLFRPDGVTAFPVGEMPLIRALAGECSDQVEMVVRNPAFPEGRVISVSARPVELGGRPGAVAVFHDITERKHVETELRGFAGVVAHDLKSPLTSVRGYAEIVAEAVEEIAAGAGPQALEQARRGTGKVISGAERMQRLITELLDYAAARDATLREDDVDLRALVDEVVTTRTDAPEEEPGTRPDVFVGPLPAVRADPVLLRQVIDNLVGNAIKYTPPGRAPRIDITARTGGDGVVRVRVADRGIGIPDGEHAAVFDSFHRASNGRAHQGTGLGLAICRRIVERHGGHIEAEPNPGGGTIFSFTLHAASSVDERTTTESSLSGVV
ncbi:ATP-binding protein [Actinoplanes sp. NPDC051851]|uniref:ATP-binding protein n=1 Tax=Actinoplanes sp. NPDC051851 TaxID=3154753 RepID=UPI0034153384